MKTISKLPNLLNAILLLSLVGACGPSGGGKGGDDDDDGGSTPSVISSNPAAGASNVPLNGSISATFSEAMDPATITESTFTVTYGVSALPVSGTVIYSNETAVFWPAAYLASNGGFNVTISSDAMSLAGVALASANTWDFATGSSLISTPPVNLGMAGDFAILAKSAISTVPASAVTGDVALSPAAASYITGFTLTADQTNVFSTSTQVTGKIYAANYSSPTPSNLTTAVGDMELAFTDAAGRAADEIELGAGDISGMTLTPGVYKWGTSVVINSDVYLDGSSTDVWILQIAQDLTMASGIQVHLLGNALPKNIFWQVAGAVTLGTTSHLEGVVLSQTAITLDGGASVNGRLLAQTAVDINAATIVEPAP